MSYPAKAQSAGGKATAKILRTSALAKYYENPSICATCGEIIRVKPTQKIFQARRKKFCNRSCSASSNNRKFPKRPRRPEVPCSGCHKPLRSKSGRCNRCRIDHMIEKSGDHTRGDLSARRASYISARNTIRAHAVKAYRRSGKPTYCASCGYATYTEVCHIRPVSDFPDDATLSEINHPDNLIALCPNHHWEFDNGVLSLTPTP